MRLTDTKSDAALGAALDAAVRRVDWPAFATRLNAGLADVRPRPSTGGVLWAVGSCAAVTVLLIVLLGLSAVWDRAPIDRDSNTGAPAPTVAAEMPTATHQWDYQELLAQLPPPPPDPSMLNGRAQ